MPIATTAPQPLPGAKKRLIGFGKRERHGWDFRSNIKRETIN
jgi:hypothetical protein